VYNRPSLTMYRTILYGRWSIPFPCRAPGRVRPGRKAILARAVTRWDFHQIFHCPPVRPRRLETKLPTFGGRRRTVENNVAPSSSFPHTPAFLPWGPVFRSRPLDAADVHGLAA